MDLFVLRYDVLFVDVLYEIYNFFLFFFFLHGCKVVFKKKNYMVIFLETCKKKGKKRKRGRNLFKDDQISHFQQFVLFLIWNSLVHDFQRDWMQNDNDVIVIL